MANYKYIARTKEGKPREGFIEARTDEEVIGVLQSQDLTIISFKQIAAQEVKQKAVQKQRNMHSGVKLDDMIALSRQLSTLLAAGITLLRALEIIVMQMQSKKLHDALIDMKRDISAGSSLKNAATKYPAIFTKLWINIIDTGETTGQLPFALSQLTSYLESSSSLQRKIKGALIYPCVVLSVAALAVTVFIVKIIPMFYKIYSGFGAALPPFTELVFAICLSIRKYLLLSIGFIAVAIFGIRYYGKGYQGRKNIDTFKLRLMLLGDIIREIAAVRFASGLNMLIKSGTPILHALDIVIETSGNLVIKEMLQDVKDNVRQGKSMAEPLIKGGLFPDMLAHMVAVGEESGELANMLDSAAKFYDERVTETISRLTTLFEPILIVVIGAIVGTLVIAMFLPIFGLSGAMTG